MLQALWYKKIWEVIVFFVIHFAYLFLHWSVMTHTCHFFVVVFHGNFCIYNSWFYVILPFLVFCFCSSEVYLLLPNFNIQIFVIVFVHMTHVRRVSLQIALWHLLHKMFCWSFSIIWLTIVFSPYLVLSKVRYLPVGTVLQWIHVCCGLWEVSFMHNATLFIDMISCSKSFMTISCICIVQM